MVNAGMVNAVLRGPEEAGLSEKFPVLGRFSASKTTVNYNRRFELTVPFLAISVCNQQHKRLMVAKRLSAILF